MDETTGRAEDLCLSCGLCCDGGLFDRVDLDATDRERLAQAGLDAPERLPHPCEHYAAGPCAIYNLRPETCRAYRCEVLKALDEGALGFAAARNLVDQALLLRRRADAELPEGLTAHQAAKRSEIAGPGERTAQTARAAVAYVAYRRFVERHFLSDSDARVKALPVSRP